MVITAFPTYGEGVLRLASDGVIPVQQRDTLLKQVLLRNLDSNKPFDGPGDLVEVNVERTRKVVESTTVLVRVQRNEDGSVVVDGEETTSMPEIATAAAAIKTAETRLFWRRESSELEDIRIQQNPIDEQI